MTSTGQNVGGRPKTVFLPEGTKVIFRPITGPTKEDHACAEAAHFGCTMTTDEWFTWWQDMELQRYILDTASLLCKDADDMEDMRQEGWEAVCQCKPDSGKDIIYKAAYRAIYRIYQRRYLRKKQLRRLGLAIDDDI